MSDSDFEMRLDRVTRAATAVKDIENPDLQAEAFRYLLGSEPADARGGTDAPETGIPAPEPQNGETEKGNGNSNGNGKKSASRRTRPSGVSPDKSLDLSPKGKQSFLDFATEKNPQTHIERYTVCVYWILEVAEQPKATVAQIVTCYHAAQWALPTDVRNTVSQAGKKELDNTGGFDDIKLANLGRNLVLGLPKAAKKK